MGKLFGTDGIRNRVNEYPVTDLIALKTGKALAVYCRSKTRNRRVRAVVARDPRTSGAMLESALIAGMLSMGMDVIPLGILPTPAAAQLVKTSNSDCAVVITASHNPACDNGIKIFDRQGFKLTKSAEDMLEKMILTDEIAYAHAPAGITGALLDGSDALAGYKKYAWQTIGTTSLEGMKIVVDCANGSACRAAPEIFRGLGAEVIAYNDRPDGKNINLNCGAVHPEAVSRLVAGHRADLALALDGDGDRVIFCDPSGNIIDGDAVIGMCVLAAQQRGTLRNNKCAVTVMSNLGFHKAMRSNNIEVITTDVGDQHVIDAMRQHDCQIGGEQSGHIIFLDHGTSGDGIVTALQVMKLIKESGKTLTELAEFMHPYPQKLLNLPVKRKIPLAEMHQTMRTVSNYNRSAAGEGRVMVRFSGTENKLRILAEAAEADEMEKILDQTVKAAMADLEEK